MIFGKYFYFFSDNMVLFSILFPLFIFSKFTHKSDSVENTEIHANAIAGRLLEVVKRYHNFFIVISNTLLTEHILALLSAHQQAYRWLVHRWFNHS